MKKFILMMVACAAMSVQAQSISTVKQVASDDFGMIPASLTSEGKTLLVFGYHGDNWSLNAIGIMDSSFGEVKTLNVPVKTFQQYRIVYDVVDGQKVNGVKEELGEWSCSLFEEISLYDVENFDDEDHHIAAAQTLFNSDEAFEYLQPNYEMGLASSYYYDWENKWYDEYHPIMTSISVVQDNGNVLATIPATSGRIMSDVSVLKSYDGVYVLVEEYEIVDEDREYTTVVYKWNDNGTGVSRVKEVSGMRAYPNPARRSETVTVDIPENVHDGMLLVTNSAGMTLQKVKLDGQRQAAVSTARMSSGIYNVTLLSGGKRVQTTRIIVK